MTQALALQDAVSKLGYSLEIDKITVEELNARVLSADRDYDLVTSSWGADFPDPASNLYSTYTSENTGEGGSNGANYRNPVVDQLLHEQGELTDNTERTKKMLEAQAILAEDTPYIIFHFVNYTMVLGDRFAGYTPSAFFIWETWAKDVHQVQ
jgi:ABC-type transport system substrate-binding protein